MQKTFAFIFILFLLIFLTGCQEDIAGEAIEPLNQNQGVLYLGLMIHLEEHDGAPYNEEAFGMWAGTIREHADLLEQYDAKGTFEARPHFLEGCINWNDNVLLELYQRGHAIGVHADIGGDIDANMTQEEFTDYLGGMKLNLEALTGVDIIHVSGICSHLDWVQAAIDAGYEYTTGGVGYCAMSMPQNLRPDEYQFCIDPSACHGTLIPDLEDRMHPWRTSSGDSWILHDPAGELVILAPHGSMGSIHEEYNNFPGSYVFTMDDIITFDQVLDEALSYSTSDETNIFYFSMSIGGGEDEVLMEELLKSIQPYVASGQVEWKTTTQMYLDYVMR